MADLTPSQAARDAAADAYRALNYSPAYVGRVRRGHASSKLVQAFARFEAATLARAIAAIRAKEQQSPDGRPLGNPGRSWNEGIAAAVAAVEGLSGEGGR